MTKNTWSGISGNFQINALSHTNVCCVGLVYSDSKYYEMHS